jgi:hypothetical protein
MSLHVHVAAFLAKFGVLRGLWHYLTVRSQLHVGLEKERLRNQAFAEHRDRLPESAELMDYEDHGDRKFWIRKTGPSDRPPGLPLPPTVVLELQPITAIAETTCGHRGDEGKPAPRHRIFMRSLGRLRQAPG